MRANENIVEEKVREFLNPKLAELMPGPDGSVAEKVLAIYSLFQEGSAPSNQENANVTKAILECMENPDPLFAGAPKNSEITTLNIHCEFRRQLVRYIWNLVPAELKDDKKEFFDNALKTITQIQNQLSVRNLGCRGATSGMVFLTGIVLLGLYFYNSQGKIVVQGSLWGVLGALLVAASIIFGTHTSYVACRQRKSLQFFQNVAQSESTPLLSSGNIQIEPFRGDLFSKGNIMRVATAKLKEVYVNNQDVTFQSRGEATTGLMVAAAALSFA